MKLYKAISLTLGSALMLAVLLLATGCSDAVLDAPEEAETQEATHAVPSKMRLAHLFDGAGKIMTRYEDLADETDFIVGLSQSGVLNMQRVMERYGGEEGVEIKRSFKRVLPGFALYIDPLHRERLLAIIDADDNIAWMEPDAKVRRKPDSNVKQNGSPKQILPWNIQQVGAPLSPAFSGNGSGSVDVDLFILDTGVMDKDLNVVTNRSFGSGNTKDGIGHGTHVAGIAAAEDNGDGVVGVAPGARVHNLKVLNGQGQAESSIVIEAIEWLTEYKLAHPATPMVANLSFGADVGTSEYTALDEAIQESIKAGVVYVIAAGNDGIDASTVTPAHVEEAITVGAYDQRYRFASFSNHGPSVDLLAPGVEIVSLRNHRNKKSFKKMSGTSMAAPHVAGAAALVLSLVPNATPQQVRDLLVGHAPAVVTDTPANTTTKSLWVGPAL